MTPLDREPADPAALEPSALSKGSGVKIKLNSKLKL